MRKPSSSSYYVLLLPFIVVVVVNLASSADAAVTTTTTVTAADHHRQLRRGDGRGGGGGDGTASAIAATTASNDLRRLLYQQQPQQQHRRTAQILHHSALGRRRSLQDGVLHLPTAAAVLLHESAQGNADTNSNSNTELSPRIVGGTLVSPGTYPFFVQGSGCGGTLVANDVVLTAAHCLEAFNANVIVGNTRYDVVTDGAQLRKVVSNKIQHPQYDELTMEYDYMMFKIEAVTDSTLVPAALNDNDSVPYDNQTVTVTGFGATSEGGSSSQDLLDVDLLAIDTATCQSQIDVVMPGVTVDPSTMLCAGIDAGGYDSCQGDSGGPLLTKDNVLVGIVSFGPGCAHPHTPGMYSRVSTQIDWIRSTLCQLTDSPPSYCDQYSGGNSGNNGTVTTTDDGANVNDDDGTRCLWCVWEWINY